MTPTSAPDLPEEIWITERNGEFDHPEMRCGEWINGRHAAGAVKYIRSDIVRPQSEASAEALEGKCSKTGIRYKDAIKELQDIFSECDLYGVKAKYPTSVRVRVLGEAVIEAALATPVGWRPISSAPRDGRIAVFYRPLAHLSNDPHVAVKRT